MKVCPNCQTQLDDSAAFCPNCGTQFSDPQPEPQTPPPVYQQPYQNYAPAYDAYDHTAEFDPQDISDNKVMAMIVYLMGWVGIVIALLGSHSSPYTAFHVRQALKFTVVETLLTLCIVFLFWTIIVPLVAGIVFVVLFVIKIMCFFQICSGKAKEPALIRNLQFLR